jgi:hypothetical protein
VVVDPEGDRKSPGANASTQIPLKSETPDDTVTVPEIVPPTVSAALIDVVVTPVVTGMAVDALSELFPLYHCCPKTGEPPQPEVNSTS